MQYFTNNGPVGATDTADVVAEHFQAVRAASACCRASVRCHVRDERGRITPQSEKLRLEIDRSPKRFEEIWAWSPGRPRVIGYLSPYFAAKAGMDALAVLCARELALWGIETSIIVPGAFTKGTNHCGV